MPIQIQEINDENDAMDCPLCMELLEVDDINFFPCVCGYQICRFCWHRIRTDENGLCPACRTSYPENPAEFKPLTGSDLQKIKNEKKQKEVQRRQKLTDNRRHLAAIRVLQKNLVFVVGLSQRLSDPEVLKRQEYFGKYGKIVKVVINNNTAYAGTQGPSSSAYVTYSKMEEALGAIQSVNNVHVDGRTLKASLGTTKYCSTYLKNQQCHKSDCMYLHELADEEASFTKEDMQAGKHQEFEQRLIEQLMPKEEATYADTDSLTTTPPLNTVDIDATEHRSRRHSGSVQQTDKRTENSWASTTQGGEQASSASLSSLEDKLGPARPTNKGKGKKTLREVVRQGPKLQDDIDPPFTLQSALDSPPFDSSPASLALNSIETTGNSFPQISSEPDPINLEQPTRPISIPLSSRSIESNATEQSLTSKTADQNDILSQGIGQMNISGQTNISNPTLPFSRPRQPETFGASSSFLLSSMFNSREDPFSWSHQPPRQPMPEPAQIHNTNGWESAFRFGKNVSPSPPNTTVEDAGDDDLGFDPWAECNKGLADLIEKESASRYHLQTAQSPTTTNMQTPFPRQSQFDAKPPNPNNGFLSPSLQATLFAPSSQPTHRHDHRVPIQPLATKDPMNTNGMSEWKSGLRALLPSVNINFAMDRQPPSANPPGFSRFPPHTSPPAGRGHSLPNPDRWEYGQSLQMQSNLFPNFSGGRQQSAFFQNRMGLAQTGQERPSALGPPPGLGLESNTIDPAIIASGSKPFSMPVSSQSQQQQQQQSMMEETPHWMKSLQALTDFDSPTSPVTNTNHELPSVNPPSTQSSFSSWPLYAGSSMSPFSAAPPNPPPGFQSRLPYTASSDFNLRHNLLENKS